MFKRVLVIGSATGLALLVLLVTMLAEPAKQTPGAGSATTPAPGENVGAFEPGSKAVGRDGPLGATKGVRYTRQNDRGVLTMIGGRDLIQKPQGVAEVIDPWARVFLTPTRVLEIRAERGNFVVPDRQPRNGEFEGRVVITLYDNGGKPVDLSGAREEDIAMRVFLRDAKFDFELGDITSSGPIHLTSPRVDFKGTGLRISYNEVKKRVDTLEVAEGQQIRLKQTSDEPLAAKREDEHKTGDGGDATTKPAPQAPQFYRATLEKRVRIHGPTLDVDAEKLVAVFSMERSGGSEKIMKGMSGARAPSPSHEPILFVPAAVDPRFAIVAGLVPQIIGQTKQPFEYPLPPDKAMIKEDPANDLVITWAGKMTVEPEETQPAGIARADDVWLELTGKPLKVTTYKREPTAKDNRGLMQEIILAESFAFFTRSGHLTLKGSEQFPLVMDSVALGGRLRGPALAVDQEKGVGQILGAGSLESFASAGRAEAGDHRMPTGLKIAWRDQLDLTFLPREAKDAAGDDAKNDLIRLRGLSHAAFRGGVAIDDPQFTLQSDLLSIGLTEAEKGRPTLETIQATGHVRINGKGEGEANKLAVSSEELEVKLERDASGDPQPTKLIAKRSVHAELPHRTLDAGLLEVGLMSAKGAIDTTRPAAEIASGRLAVRSIDASENVRIATDDPMTITGDRVVADLPKDEIELHGTAQKPARVQRPDGGLVGEKIFMNQKTQVVRIPGPGQFQFQLRDIKPTVPARTPTAPAAGALPGAGGDAPVTAAGEVLTDHLATATWRDEMAFDNLNNHAHFAGDVHILGRSGNDVTRLRADDLKLDFVPDPNAAKDAGKAKEKRSEMKDWQSQPRVLNSMTATKDAHFEVETWEGVPTKSKRLRHLEVNGPTMTFAQAKQEMKVPGPGTMLMLDERPAPPEVKVDETKVSPDGEPPSTPAQFTGRGSTLMKWDGMLTLNMERNEMLVEKNVRMVHEPADKKGDMKLFCATLLTDLQDTGGMESWMSGKAQPTLKMIKADGDVNVLVQGRTIKTDHLQFTEADQIVKLKSDGDKEVEMTSPNDPNAYTAKEFKWNLKSGAIEIITPGAGRVPVGK